MPTLRNEFRRLAALFLASSTREVMAAWLLPFIMLGGVVVLPSQHDESGASSFAAAVRPLTRGMQQSATTAMLPCEDEAGEEPADSAAEPEILHARTPHPALGCGEC